MGPDDCHDIHGLFIEGDAQGSLTRIKDGEYPVSIADSREDILHRRQGEGVSNSAGIDCMVVDTPLGLAVPLLDWEKRAGPWRLQQAYHSFLHPLVKLHLQLALLLGVHRPQLLLDWHSSRLGFDCICQVPS